MLRTEGSSEAVLWWKHSSEVVLLHCCLQSHVLHLQFKRTAIKLQTIHFASWLAYKWVWQSGRNYPFIDLWQISVRTKSICICAYVSMKKTTVLHVGAGKRCSSGLYVTINYVCECSSSVFCVCMIRSQGLFVQIVSHKYRQAAQTYYVFSNFLCWWPSCMPVPCSTVCSAYGLFCGTS